MSPVDANPDILTALNKHGVAIFLKTSTGIYEVMNRAGAAMLGKPLHAIVGLTDFEIFEKPSATFMLDRDERMIKLSAMTAYDSIVRTDETWMRFQTSKMGIDVGPGRRSLLGLSLRVDEKRDSVAEQVMKDACAQITAAPQAFVDRLLTTSHPDFLIRSHWRELSNPSSVSLPKLPTSNIPPEHQGF